MNATPDIVDDDGCIPRPRMYAGPDDDDGCDHPDHSEDSGPDTPDTDAG